VHQSVSFSLIVGCMIGMWFRDVYLVGDYMWIGAHTILLYFSISIIAPVCIGLSQRMELY
jgi:hypothetical protein